MLTLKTATSKDFQKICEYIREFELDNRDLQEQQFTCAFRDDQLVGFGRLREHSDCIELCSLGVVALHRRQGIGKAIVSELIKRTQQRIYLVCIIPDFFIPFGFRSVEKYPSSILDKLHYCTQELIVPETYVAMCLRNDLF